MSKKRKIHQLLGTINYAWLSQTKHKQPFHYLDITQESLFGENKTTLYVFPNLVNKDVWNVLEQQTFNGNTYHFYCEKRVRGWSLKRWEEIN